MQRQRILMTTEEYHLLEQPFGYKVEYWDDHTVITPRDNPVTTRLAITAREINPTCRIVPVDPMRQQEMAETAFGFVDIYDQMYIRLKYAWYRDEIWRREKLGLTEGLVAERDRWDAQLDEMWRH